MSDELKEENSKQLRNIIVKLNLQLQEHKEQSPINIKPLPKIDENTKLNIAIFGGGSFGTGFVVPQ